MQNLPNKISIEQCKKLIPDNNKHSNKQIRSIRNVLYKLANVVIQKFEEIRNFFTQNQTIEAKAKIVHN